MCSSAQSADAKVAPPASIGEDGARPLLIEPCRSPAPDWRAVCGSKRNAAPQLSQGAHLERRNYSRLRIRILQSFHRTRRRAELLHSHFRERPSTRLRPREPLFRNSTAAGHKGRPCSRTSLMRVCSGKGGCRTCSGSPTHISRALTFRAVRLSHSCPVRRLSRARRIVTRAMSSAVIMGAISVKRVMQP